MRDPLRVAMILPGLGRVQRGAEAAFLELARQWVERPGVSLTLFGSGEQGYPEAAQRHVLSCRSRETFEKWPKFPLLASEYYYEEFSFVLSLAKSRRYKPKNFDVVVSCSYPWLNWYLQRVNGRKGPLSFYVTQNGDWPCYERKNEGKFFKCDGLVCTNPVYYERNRQRYACALIPNGVDPDRFTPRPAGEPMQKLAEVGQVGEGRVVLIASAMIRVEGRGGWCAGGLAGAGDVSGGRGRWAGAGTCVSACAGAFTGAASDTGQRGTRPHAGLVSGGRCVLAHEPRRAVSACLSGSGQHGFANGGA